MGLTGYELCYSTKPGSAAPVLTWRMTRDAYQNWRTQIIDMVRRGGDRESGRKGQCTCSDTACHQRNDNFQQGEPGRQP